MRPWKHLPPLWLSALEMRFLISLDKLCRHLMVEHQKWEAGPRRQNAAGDAKPFPCIPLAVARANQARLGGRFLIFHAAARAVNCRTGLLVESNWCGRSGYFFNVIFASAPAEGSQSSIRSSWWLSLTLVLIGGVFVQGLMCTQYT